MQEIKDMITSALPQTKSSTPPPILTTPPSFSPRQRAELWKASYLKMLAARNIDNTHNQLAAIMAALRTKQSAGGKGVAFLGGTGTGKTVRMKLLQEVIGGVYTDAMDLFARASRYIDDPESFDNAINMPLLYCDNPFRYYFYLDDIGTEPAESVKYGQRNDLMESVIRRRYVAFLQGHVTCFSSNMTEPDLLRRYGERIVSRMKEMAFFIDMTGRDRRLSR